MQRSFRKQFLPTRAQRFKRMLLRTGHAAMEKPLVSIVLLAVIAAASAAAVALGLRVLRPQSSVVLAGFEVPSFTDSDLKVNAKVEADLFGDQLRTILDQANSLSSLTELVGRGEATSSRGAAADLRSLTLTSQLDISGVNIEVKGVSVDRLVDIWRALRQDQKVIHGDVLLTRSRVVKPMEWPNGGPSSAANVDQVVVRAEIAGIGAWQSSRHEANPEGLARANAELAEKLVSDLSPYIMGRALLRRGDLDGAVQIFSKKLATCPAEPRCMTDLADALYRKNDLDAAIAWYREALKVSDERHTPNPELHNSLGNALNYRGFAAEAFDEYKLAAALGSAAAKNNYGIWLLNHSRREEAIQQFKQIISADANNADAHASLGAAFEDAADRNSAVAEYRQAVRLRPGEASFHANLAYELMELGQFNLAIPELREALRLDKNESSPHVSLCWALNQRGEHDAAIAECKAALSLGSKSEWGHNNLGNAYEAQRHYSEAAKEYRTAIAINPTQALCHVNLARVLQVQKAYREAEDEYRKGISLDAKLMDGIEGLTSLLNEKGRYAEAIKLLSDSLTIRDDVRQHTLLARTFEHDKQLSKAIDEAGRALSLDRQNPNTYYYLGTLLEQAGNNADAESQYTRALALYPNYHLSRKHLIRLLQKLGRTREAEEQLAMARRIDASFDLAAPDMAGN